MFSFGLMPNGDIVPTGTPGSFCVAEGMTVNLPTGSGGVTVCDVHGNIVFQCEADEAKRLPRKGEIWRWKCLAPFEAHVSAKIVEVEGENLVIEFNNGEQFGWPIGKFMEHWALAGWVTGE